MRLVSLQSGSSGNCIYVESENVRLLFDAGIAAAQVTERLAPHNIDPTSLDALFISHDHSDHVRCAGIYTRRFHVPLYITEKTLAASRKFISPSPDTDLRLFKGGSSVKVKHVTIETICTPHDASDGVVFVIDDGKSRLGICTDVGHVFSDLKSLVSSVDGLFLESNFDEKMLENGFYPQFLKRRISGPGGHISNREAANLIADHASSKLKWVCLAHLSEKNNTRKKALTAHEEALGKTFPLYMTSRYKAIPPITLGEATPQMTFDF